MCMCVRQKEAHQFPQVIYIYACVCTHIKSRAEFRMRQVDSSEVEFCPVSSLDTLFA